MFQLERRSAQKGDNRRANQEYFRLTRHCVKRRTQIRKKKSHFSWFPPDVTGRGPQISNDTQTVDFQHKYSIWFRAPHTLHAGSIWDSDVFLAPCHLNSSTRSVAYQQV